VFLTKGYPAQKLVDMGFKAEQVEVVYKRVSGTHWKRRMPTVAMVSDSAIGEYYRRPVDY
jgi:NAD+ synthase